MNFKQNYYGNWGNVTKATSFKSFLHQSYENIQIHETNNPPNIRLDEDVLKMCWRRLSSSSSEDVLIKTNIFALVIRLQDVFKTSWSRPIYWSWLYVFKTSSRRLVKTSSRRLAKTSSRYLAKTSSRHLQDVLQSRLQDVFKTINCLPRSRIWIDHTSEKFMVSVENLQVW